MKLLTILLVFIACNNESIDNNDFFKEKFISKFYLHKHFHQTYFSHNENSTLIIENFNSIIQDLKQYNECSSITKEKIELQINAWKKDYQIPHDETLLYLINSNKLFQKNKITFIESLLFLESFFEFSTPRLPCIDEIDSELLLAIDTLILFENKEYEFPISFKTTDYFSKGIVENSLQGDHVDIIKFKTVNSSNKLNQIPLQLRTYYSLSGKTEIIHDTIYYKSISNY